MQDTRSRFTILLTTLLIMILVAGFKFFGISYFGLPAMPLLSPYADESLNHPFERNINRIPAAIEILDDNY